MEGNSITTFENLCKIFEMRIKLDNEKGTKTSTDVLSNYEKYSKKIDSIYNSQFQKELKPLISPAVTLEKEEERLKRLIKLLEERLDKRIELEDRFYNSTNKYITGLQAIVSEAELEDKKERLALVSRYLETSKEIDDVTESVNKLRDLLTEEEKKKEDYESKNKIMENELYSSFIKVIKERESISEEDISSELDEIRSKVSEAKETLDITKESVGSLITNGLEDDYASYVEEAERSYFTYKSREIILKIYKLVMNLEDDFKVICGKREKISELLEENKILRENLSINTEDELLSFEKVVLMQNSTLKNEKEVLENIANYVSRIKFKEERLEELKEVNSSVEILAILREYGLIDTYDTEEISVDEESVDDTSNLDELIVKEEYNPYRIVSVKDYPKTLNVGLAKLKGESVREKVNKKLNPKLEETTFEDITSSLVIDENTLMKEQNSNQMVDDNTISAKKETEIPSEILKSDFEEKVETPVVWELPSDIENNNLPVWGEVKLVDDSPKEEEISNIDILPKAEESNSADNSMFWVPVSDSKLETKELPNINIPISGAFNGNDNFGFPTINN